MLISSFWAFISFCMLAFVGFLLLSEDALSYLFFTNDEWLMVWLVCTLLLLLWGQWQSFHIRLFIFEVCLSNVSWRVLNLFLTVTLYLFLTSLRKWGLVIMCDFDCFLFLCRLRDIFAVTILWVEDTPSKEEHALLFRVLFIHFLFNLSMI